MVYIYKPTWLIYSMGQELELTESELRCVRKAFYRGIAENVYTGYNVYSNPYDIKPFFLDYFHSDLTPRHRHFKELKKVLIKEGFLDPIPIIQARGIYKHMERAATYLTLPLWRRSKRGKRFRFFTIDGKEISPIEARKSDLEVIGEAMEYNMLLSAKNEDDLNELLNLFKIVCSKFKLDRYGTYLKERRSNNAVENRKAIYGSDDVPLITTRTKPVNREDLIQLINCEIPFLAGKRDVTVSTFVRRKNLKKLKSFLRRNRFNNKTSVWYALRAFVEEYYTYPQTIPPLTS